MNNPTTSQPPTDTDVPIFQWFFVVNVQGNVHHGTTVGTEAVFQQQVRESAAKGVLISDVLRCELQRWEMPK